MLLHVQTQHIIHMNSQKLVIVDCDVPLLTAICRFFCECQSEIRNAFELVSDTLSSASEYVGSRLRHHMML